MLTRKRVPIVPAPDRVHRIQGSFAWLDHRLLREGHVERMTLQDLAVYVFLVLAADRTGTSFYRKDVVCRKLGIDWGEFEESKARFLERGLIAFRPFAPNDVDGFYQVLPVPIGGRP
jgi:hypothetical protein